MKNHFIIFGLILFSFTKLFSFQSPVLLDVKEYISDSLFAAEYRIENFQEGVETRINIYKKDNLNIIRLNEQKIIGDYGELEKKGKYKFAIPLKLLPAGFNFKDYTAFPKIVFQNRIYYEMKKIKKGGYSFHQDKEKIASETTNGFYISKFEVSNEQFAAFINDDGYEIKEYWLVKEGIMENREVGWNFQGRFRISAPLDWDLNEIPYWKSAASYFIYGPVTSIRWFEANAFCNWMGCSLPGLSDISICFSFNSIENDSLFNPVCSEIDEKGQFPLHFIKSNVSEWLILSIDSNIPPCGPGCREMFYLKNNSQMHYGFPVKGISCPLYNNEILGFRYKIEK